ncbi:MAG: LysR family transcriptional regulator [Verrucomicrobiota bacterium]
MHIETLKLFLDLARSGRFSKAGEVNKISQSAVSQRIMRLEEELGVKLVVRGGRSEIELTVEGKVFFCGCEDILARYGRLLEELIACNGEISGEIRVSAEPSLARFWLPDRLEAFLLRYPTAEVRVESASFEAVYSQVLSGEAEIGLVAYPMARSGVAIEPLPSEELALLASSRYRTDERDELALRDLEAERFVAFASNEEMLHDIRRQFAVQGVLFAPAVTSDTVEGAKRAVEEGGGVTLLPVKATEELAAQDLIPLRLKRPVNPRPLGALMRSNGSPNALFCALLAWLKEPDLKTHL